MSYIVKCKRCGDEHEDTLGDSICVDCRKPSKKHNISVAIGNKISVGSCNFCYNSTSPVVLVVRSINQYCNLEVRFCPDCFKELCKQGKKK